eukprot:NODE_3763_length_921_cov_51.050459_g3460_i0.p1 GENE.NODE_3763_length_921_cov_51.050459_g3460_i0~~NODE_3763_length_921_cov_51.050459_g3460_i0.p1  ORF type:complete len:228 (+),score=19.08 NODE_3763_length_921_cov_51.050459_g3460_i0:94-777(+)
MILSTASFRHEPYSWQCSLCDSCLRGECSGQSAQQDTARASYRHSSLALRIPVTGFNHTSISDPAHGTMRPSTPSSRSGSSSSDGLMSSNSSLPSSAPSSQQSSGSPAPSTASISQKSSRKSIRVREKSCVDISKYKTQLCHRFMVSGACRFESTCCFAHSESDLRSVAANQAILARLTNRGEVPEPEQKNPSGGDEEVIRHVMVALMKCNAKRELRKQQRREEVIV